MREKSALMLKSMQSIRQAATLEIATKLSAGYPEISYYEANILKWDRAEAYDVVLCSLTLHHFSDEDAVKVLRRCRKLSKRFVLVSDLRRGFLLRFGVHHFDRVNFSRTDDALRRAAFCRTRLLIFRNARSRGARRLEKFWA